MCIRDSGWTVAYGGPNTPRLEPGSAVLLAYAARGGKKVDTRPEAGRTPADVVPLAPLSLIHISCV